MNTTTFTATFTFPTESIIGFANYLGYSETIDIPQYHEDGTIPYYSKEPNPENQFDFIKRLVREHNEKFVTQWAEHLSRIELEKQMKPIKEQIEQAVIAPVKNAIQITYEEN